MGAGLIENLQTLAANDALARRAFEVLAQRQRKRTELTVEVLMRDMGCPRGDTVKFFKLLEELGCGKFFTGRGSKPSRFRWRYAMYSVAQVALGQGQPLEELPWDGDTVDEDEQAIAGAADGSMPPPPAVASILQTVDLPTAMPRRLNNYSFPLRPDLLVPLALPVDLTLSEAERLSVFVKALAVTPHVAGKPSDT